MKYHGEQLERTNENVQNNAERKLLRRTRGYDPRPKSRIMPVPPEFLESSPKKKKPLKPAPKKVLLKPEKPQTPQKKTKKLTVLIDAELLTKFKIQALTDETTLSALVTKAFEDYLD